MSLLKKRIGAALLASVLAFTVSTDAQARGGGGGGHGGGGGGGHFGGGGGGMHFGGGGMHFGGGGMHFGGGGMHFGGMHFGSLGRIGGIRFGGRSFHPGGRSFAHRGVSAGHFAGRVNSGRSFAARHGVHAAGAAAALGAGHVAGRAVAHNNFGHDHFPPGHFAHNFHNLAGGYGYGWYGPLFWPYAYDDIFDDLFWAFGYGDPFWGYGYGDIYGGLFSPYGYDDLAGYLPGGAYGQAGTSSGRAGTSSGPASRVIGSTESRQTPLSSQLSQMCGDDSREVAGWPIDRIEQSVSPTREQRAAFDGFANATIGAAQTIKNACPTNVAFAPTGRLDAMQKRLEGMAQAVDIVSPPLAMFYTSLTDEQKARLNAANEKESQNGGPLASCSAVSNATRWPGDQIEKAVRPNPEQQAKLDGLKMAMANAADDLAKACPSTLPTTPPARLVAISMRLNTMLQAVKNVRAALDDFYTSLSDEQKSQFNMIGRQHTAQK
jgi:LTXXQ motif family protein